MKKLILSLSLVFLGIAALFLPYHAWLERRLEVILKNKGLENVRLTIGNLGFKSASLENVAIGNEKELKLKNITIGYSLRELRNGNIQDLSIHGVHLDIRQSGGRWIIDGLESWDTDSAGDQTESFSLPVRPEQIARIPFERIAVADSSLNLHFSGGKLSLPLEVRWQKVPEPQFNYKGDNLSLNFGNHAISAKNLTLKLRVENSKWTGPWSLSHINIKDAAIPIPQLSGNGTVQIDKGNGVLNGHLKSSDNLWRANFNTNYSFNAPEKSVLNILHARMPWKEGGIEVKNVSIPLFGKNPVKITLELYNVSIQELMTSLTGGRVTATGRVSGALPLRISRAGKVTVLQGNLKSEGPGVISMSANSIPGNNEQVALVREILENLQYTSISIEAKNNQSNGLNVTMAFEGHNPDVYDGRPVKLNVNLTGDVLEFLQQNILLYSNPEQLLKQRNE